MAILPIQVDCVKFYKNGRVLELFLFLSSQTDLKWNFLHNRGPGMYQVH